MGPGKASLLEAIDRTGSISAAARDLEMSYRRAWLLVDTMNQCFRQPLVSTETGGQKGGGAHVTEFGHDVLRRYLDMEVKAAASVEGEMAQFVKLMAKAPPADRNAAVASTEAVGRSQHCEAARLGDARESFDAANHRSVGRVA